MVHDRYNQINDSVTHVIVDSLTEDIVSQLKAASVTARYTTTTATCFCFGFISNSFCFVNVNFILKPIGNLA